MLRFFISSRKRGGRYVYCGFFLFSLTNKASRHLKVRTATTTTRMVIGDEEHLISG